jgi:hypothetical protein
MCATCCISTALPGWSGIGGGEVVRAGLWKAKRGL